MKLQQIVAIVLLASLMFGAGLQLDRTSLLATFRNVGLLARAVLANFVVVPAIAFACTYVFRIAQPIAIGLLLMAIAPGVPFVVLSGGRQKGGDHELAVSLALLLPAISVLTVPVTADLVLPVDMRGGVPMSHLAGLMLFQLLPLVAGALVAGYAPAIARRVARPVSIAMLVSLIALLAIVAPTIVRSVTMVFGTFGIFAMLVTTLLSLAAGWLLGGSRVEYRRTLGIATLLRNPALAILIASTEFQEPLVSAAVVTYFVVQFVVAVVASTVFGQAAAANP